MDESGQALEYNLLARPIVACVATTGILALTGGLFRGDIVSTLKGVGVGGASILASDYVAGAVFGGAGGMLLSPALSAMAFTGINKAMGANNSMFDLAVTGASIDIASQWMLNPVGRALGLF